MSSRYISIEEINSIAAAIEDRGGIKLLQAIRDNIVGEQKERKEKSSDKKLSAEEQQKEQQDEAKEKAIVGFSKEEDLGLDEDKGEQGILKRLEEQGLIIKGGFIPRGEERINFYKLTNEGFALLYLVDKIKEGGGGKQGGQEQREARKEEQRSNKDNTIKANESVRIKKD